MYRSWIRESWLIFGVFSALGLVLLLQTEQPVSLPFDNRVLQSFGIGMTYTLIAVLLASIVYSWRQSATTSQAERDKVKSLLDSSGSGGLIARNGTERPSAGHLSVAAGIIEELFFRLVLPATMIAIFGVEWLVPILVISILLFGIAHAYQGVSGIVLTSIIGALLMFIYISTGSIIVAIIVHILFDLRSTVALSWVAYGRK